ncbi:MAG: NCS2 family permease [Planctomycetota bacterium]
MILERWFHLREAGTTVRREVTAGLVTFVTLSYILFVQPAMLARTGMDPAGVLFATCVASAVACFAMAWLANYPFALAPAMGHNVFFAFTVCGATAMDFAWPEALAANFLAGTAFLLLARVGVRERVMDAVPDALKYAIAAGIGLLIAMVGLQWAGIVVDDPGFLVGIGDLGAPTTLLAVFGLAATSVLLVRRVPGAILIGVLVTGVAGWAATRILGLEPALVPLAGVVGAPPSPRATAFRLDFGGLFSRDVLEIVVVIFTFFVLDLFDTVATLIGVAERSGLLRDGRLPRARGAFTADAAGTVAGALLGTSTITSYVESAAGTASGGRTGLVAVVTGICLLASLFFAPLIQAIGAGVNVGSAAAPLLHYPVIAPVLVLVGVLMMGAVRRIDWDDLSQAIPAFLAMIAMPLSGSPTEGIAWGFLSWSVLSLLPGRRRTAPPLLHAISLLFVVYYVVR